MKKNVASVLGILSGFLFASNVYATTVQFGPQENRKTVEVPDGWANMGKQGACVAVNLETQSVFAAELKQNDTYKAKDMADAVNKQTDVKVLSRKDEGSVQTVLVNTADGTPMLLRFIDDGDYVIVATMTGNDEAAMDKITKTIKPVK